MFPRNRKIIYKTVRYRTQAMKQNIKQSEKQLLSCISSTSSSKRNTLMYQNKETFFFLQRIVSNHKINGNHELIKVT